MKYLIVLHKWHVDSIGWKSCFINADSKNEAMGKAHRLCKSFRKGDLPDVDFHIISKDEIIKKLLND